MKLLAWDTSSKTGVVAAFEWDEKVTDARSTLRLVSEWVLSVDAVHSEKLLWAIDQVLKAANWELKEIDYFAVGVGPGSFTGLRIGVSTARTLAHVMNKPLVEVSSLAALARPAAESALQSKGTTLVIAATDACKGELFCLFGNAKSVRECVIRARGDAPGMWGRGTEESVYSHEKLAALLKKKASSKVDRWIAVGEARIRYPQFWEVLPLDKEVKQETNFLDQVQGRYLGLLAWEAIQIGVIRKALDVTPHYIRASDAELKLKARQKS